MPTVFMSSENIIIEGNLATCKLDYLTREARLRNLFILLIIGPGVIPMVLMITFQLLTFLEIKRQKKVIFVKFKFSRAYHSSSPKYCQQLTHFDMNSVINENVNIIVIKETTLVKMNILFVACFCMTYFPYVVFVLIAQFCANREKIINHLTAFIPNIFINLATITFPVIVLMTDKVFKKFSYVNKFTSIEE